MFKFLSLLVAVFMMPLAAHAETSSGWASGSQVRAQLHAGAVRDDGIDLGLDVQFGEGWHGYWRVAGDAGLPPRFDWSASENVSEVIVEWPAPVRKDEVGFQVFGYSDRVFFPMRVVPTVLGESVNVDLALDIMVCKDICIPQSLSLNLALGKGDDQKVAGQRLIDFARKKVPHEGDNAALKVENVVVAAQALVVNISSQKGFDGLDVFAYLDDGSYAFTAVPELIVDAKDPRRAMVKLSASGLDESLVSFMDGKGLSITVVKGPAAIHKAFDF
jgi:suppressor for copper-sensitivity B